MFSLDSPKSTVPTFIFLRMTCADGRLKYPVKEKVLPSNWSGDRVIQDTKGVNITLNKIDLTITGVKYEARLKSKPLTKAWLESALDRSLGRITGAGSFYDIIDGIIADRQEGRELTKKGKRYSWHTIKGYKHTRDNLFKFDPYMTFESVTLQTYSDLIAYFNTKHNHALNSLGKTIKNWKVFMKAAKKKGVHENLIYLDEDFIIPEEDTELIALDETELTKIYNHNFPNKMLERARDWFIIGAYSALRIADIQLLDSKNLIGETITVYNSKTDIKVVIPFHPFVRSILKKYKGLPPKVIDKDMNIRIKKVCELAGIDQPVIYSLVKGGKRVDLYLKKYELVSNHTMRRCCITNLLNAGVPDNQVMQLAGIKKHSTLMRYKKTKPEQNAEIMRGHEFFR